VRNIRNGGMFVLKATNSYGYWKLQWTPSPLACITPIAGQKVCGRWTRFPSSFSLGADCMILRRRRDQDNSDSVNGARASDSTIASRLPTAAVSGRYFAFDFASNRI
jgi:hypothetical protein